MISLAAHRAMMDAVMQYVPVAQRENARAAATAVGVCYAPHTADVAALDQLGRTLDGYCGLAGRPE